MSEPQEPKPQQSPEQQEPEELQEYHYWVGFIEHTGQMTSKQAEKLNAKPINEPLDDPSLKTNKERRGSPITSTGGAQSERTERQRARQPRNK